MARMWPVEGCITTIALSSVPLTALRAACSAAGLIVVAIRAAFGAMMVVGLPDTPPPEPSSTWTDRPGLPCLVGAIRVSRFATVASPGSL